VNAISSEQLDHDLQRLPSLSIIVMDVLTLLRDDNLDLRLLEEKLKRDQSLTARILRIANSPFYGMSRKIVSIHEATVVLGIHTIRNIVTAASIIEHFQVDGDSKFNYLAFWQHAIGTGVAAKVLAAKVGADQEAAFTAGLLHNLGRICTEVLFQAELVQVAAYQQAHRCPLREAERAVLGFDHCLIGCKVAERWKLPPTLIEPIAHHHTPDMAPISVLTDLVHFADIICQGLEIGNAGEDLISVLSPSAWKRLDLTWDVVGACLKQIEELNAMSNLYFLDTIQ
jgi:putative nucleotidyltransferase with HDIG domain